MSDDPFIGRQVGDYRIVSRLGEGGMGMVYKGSHVALGQIVAIKSLHSSLMNNQAAKERFVREAQALARLNHPNIIGLKNFINNDQGCFIVMEFAEGEDLEHKLQRMGLIPPEQCVPWFIEILRALAFAHKQGIIHRDIKPSNIIVHPSGTAKLLDFGTAKLIDAKRLTQQGMTLGTIIYMSKEQLLGKALDARSDLYSLGVTLYECVTGQLPFYDEEERKLVVKIAKTEPIPPSQHYPAISKDLEALILKSMAKEPEQRFQSAEEFEGALARILGLGASTANAGPRPVMPTTGPTAAPLGPAVVQPPPPVAAYAPPPPPYGAPPVAPVAPVPLGAAAPPSILASPLVLIGAFCVVFGLAVGLPLLLIPGLPGWVKVLAAVILVLFSLLGVALLFVGFMKWSAAVAASRGAGPAPGAMPGQPMPGSAAMPGPAPAPMAGSGAGAKCPSCGRAFLPGMTSCPFCAPPPAGSAPPPHPAMHMPGSAAPTPGAPPVVPVSMSFAPGGTLNVNSANAAQQYAPAGAATASAAPRPPVGTAVLQVIDGADKGKSYQITRAAPFTIGRAPTCSATLNDPGISGTHAQLAFEGPALVVSDAGSRNGVFVNNQKIQRHQLGSGDLIVIGSTRMLVTL